MIQEQITTSSPKCLDGNAGFGVVAQTSGMAPNVARDVGMLSGYSHLFPAGDANNPVAFLHVVRRSGGTDRHVISRVADCGNDYSGRTNRIGHHWIVEESDVPALPCGPAAIASRPELFCVKWNEKSQELPRGKKLPNPPVAPGVCHVWQQWFGDAGWGGVVAERIEKGDPISIIFEPGTDPLPLLTEALALLPPSRRWKTTFSTFFMKSQEPPGTAKVQVKCIVVGSDEMAFARLTPNTLLIDLRNPPAEVPSGKYVETARTGRIAQPEIPKPIAPALEKDEVPAVDISQLPDYEEGMTYDLGLQSMSIPRSRAVPTTAIRAEKKGKKVFIWVGIFLGVAALLTLVGVMGIMYRDEIAKRFDNKTVEIATNAEEAQLAEENLTGDQGSPQPEAKPAEENLAGDQGSPQPKAKPAEENLAGDQGSPQPEVDAADKTEKEKKDPAEKAAENERKAEAAKKAERERKAAEEKAKIDALPDVWGSIALPREGGLVQTGLANSIFLWDIRKRVKLDIVPFVDLSAPLKNVEKPVKVSVKDHVVEFSMSGTDFTGKTRDESLLRFELKENGLSYQWTVPPNFNDVRFYRELNRFLLSKLQILVDGKIAKEIALWEPVKYDPDKFRHALDKDNAFNLWLPRNGKEYVVFREDKSPMLLDFNEVIRDDAKISVVEPKAYVESSLCFGPKIRFDDGAEGNFNIRPTGENLNVKIGFITSNINELLKQAENINTEKEKVLTTLQDKKFNGLRGVERSVAAKKEQLTALRQAPNAQNNPQIPALEAEIKNDSALLKEKNDLDGKVKKLQADYAAKEKEIKAEENKWSDVRIEEFSIDLLKSGTTEADVAKPENRLPLFQVASP